jgi:outer membrane protein
MQSIIKRVVLVVISVCFAAGLQAQETYRLGAVNLVRVLEKSPQYEAAGKLIKKEFDPREKQIIEERNELKELEDQLKKDRAIMSVVELKKLERDLISKRRELKRKQDEFREDLNFRRNEEFSKIQKQIVDAIRAVANEKKYDVILSEGVIFASPKVDISALILEYLSKGYEGGGEQ